MFCLMATVLYNAYYKSSMTPGATLPSLTLSSFSFISRVDSAIGQRNGFVSIVFIELASVS